MCFFSNCFLSLFFHVLALFHFISVSIYHFFDFLSDLLTSEGQNQGLEKWSKNGWPRRASAGSAAQGGRVLAGVRGPVRPRLWRILASPQHGLRQPRADGPDPKGFAPCRRLPSVIGTLVGLLVGMLGASC